MIASTKADLTTFEELQPRWSLRMNVGREDDGEGVGHMLAGMGVATTWVWLWLWL